MEVRTRITLSKEELSTIVDMFKLMGDEEGYLRGGTFIKLIFTAMSKWYDVSLEYTEPNQVGRKLMDSKNSTIREHNRNGCRVKQPVITTIKELIDGLVSDGHILEERKVIPNSGNYSWKSTYYKLPE